ncbi:TniQ family protein [Actinophytocola sp.]|uniref:TniQ family protein n=1 Tax=Actinophytocola sp. TaxID=1872138 RepID=UPI003D6B8D66
MQRRHQLRIAPAQAAPVAHALRLTIEEVSRLCLDGLRDRYPPLELDDTDASYIRRSKHLPATHGWLRGNATSYCPDCLAGDDSPIQQAHGGPSRRLWRLPVTFACVTHQRLLHARNRRPLSLDDHRCVGSVVPRVVANCCAVSR